MSYPPPPGSNPNNPYTAPQQGAPVGPYGYPQQGGYQQQGAGQPGYGYQGGMPAYPGGPGVPGGPMMPPVSMPGQVVTARVLLFVAGSLWGLFAVSMLLFGLAAGDAMEEVPGFGGAGGAAVGVGFLAFLIFGGLAALHIVPAAMFGKGRIGTRVTAIIAASLNTLIPVLAMFGSIDDTGAPAGTVFMSLLWLATAVLTIVFCSLGQAGYWFNRPQY